MQDAYQALGTRISKGSKMNLERPQNPSYDFDVLEEAVSLWDWKRKGESIYAGTGFPTQSNIARLSVSSRQWDSTGDVLDSAHETSTADIIDDALLELEPVERALVLWGMCRVFCSWVRDMEPVRAQMRYEDALHKLAMLSRRSGMIV